MSLGARAPCFLNFGAQLVQLKILARILEDFCFVFIQIAYELADSNLYHKRVCHEDGSQGGRCECSIKYHVIFSSASSSANRIVITSISWFALNNGPAKIDNRYVARRMPREGPQAENKFRHAPFQF